MFLFTGSTQLYSLGRFPLIIKNVEKALFKYPQPDIAKELIQGFKYGFKLQYTSPRQLFEINMKEIVGEKAVVANDKIYKEIKLGRIAGPFHFPPFPTLRISSISVIPKRSSSEYRLIHNLSFPENGSVNDFIDKEFSSVKYSTIDDAKLAKCDLKFALRLLRLSPGDFDLMGFKFENQYFFDKCLPMGASINCSLFEKCSTALH